MSEDPTTTPPATTRRWWSLGLLLHAGLVAVLLLTHAPALSADPSSWAARTDFAGRLTLASPWWLLAIPLEGSALERIVPPGVLQALPVVANLVLHVVVLWLLSRRPAAADSSRGPTRRWVPSGSTVLFGAAAAGVLVWVAWLGWDDTASIDVVTRQVESPYVSLQVLGCALSVGVLTAVLARWCSPVASACGVSAGFWFAWTAWAANDETGLFMIGALMLGAGLLVGTAFTAFVGYVLRGKYGPMTVSS